MDTPLSGIFGAGDEPLRIGAHIQGTPETAWERRNIYPNTGAPGELVRGQWHVVEVLIELDDSSNGVLRMWLDGVRTHELTDLSYLHPGDAGADFLQLQLSPVWGGGGDVVKETFYMYMDHSYISTSN